jgi:hypothetical protein
MEDPQGLCGLYPLNWLDCLLDAGLPNYHSYSDNVKAHIIVLGQLAGVSQISLLIGAALLCLVCVPTTAFSKGEGDESRRAKKRVLGVAFIALGILSVPLRSALTGNYQDGVAILVLTLITGVLFIAFTPCRETSVCKQPGAMKPPSGSRFVTVFGVLVLSLMGGLTGNLTGGNQTDIVSQIVPALFSAGTVAAALVIGTGAVRLRAFCESSPQAISNRNFYFLISAALAFFISFFSLYQIANEQENKQEAYFVCRSIYADAAFYTIDADARSTRDEIWGAFCMDRLDRKFDLIPDGIALQ